MPENDQIHVDLITVDPCTVFLELGPWGSMAMCSGHVFYVFPCFSETSTRRGRNQRDLARQT